jgi:hypothetical protein
MKQWLEDKHVPWTTQTVSLAVANGWPKPCPHQHHRFNGVCSQCKADEVKAAQDRYRPPQQGIDRHDNCLLDNREI